MTKFYEDCGLLWKLLVIIDFKMKIVLLIQFSINVYWKPFVDNNYEDISYFESYYQFQIFKKWDVAILDF